MKLVKVTKKDNKMQSVKKTMRKKDEDLPAEKYFGGVHAHIREGNNGIYAYFDVPSAGSGGYLQDVKRGLISLKNRVKEVESAISWAEAELKKLKK